MGVATAWTMLGGSGAGRIVTSGIGADRSIGSGVFSNSGVSGTSAVREDFVDAGTFSPTLFTGMPRESTERSIRTVSVGGPMLEPAGGSDIGATLVAKTWAALAPVVALLGCAGRLVSEGLRERGARVGVAQATDPLATSPKGELQ